MNIDIATLFTKAFEITFKHRSLWLLGLLIALGNGAGLNTSINSNNIVGMPGTTGPGGFTPGSAEGTEVLEQQMGQVLAYLQDNATTLITIGIAWACVSLLVALVLWVFAEIANGGIISSVNSIEEGQPVTTRAGWNAGKRFARPLIAMRLVLSLPVLVLSVLMLTGFAVVLAPMFGALATGGTPAPESVGPLLFLVYCLVLPLYCVILIYTIVAGILTTFGRRAIVLEGLGAMDGLRSGWALFRKNVLSSFVIAVIAIIFSFIVGAVVGLLGLALLSPVLVGLINNWILGNTLEAPAIVAAVVLVLVLSVVSLAVGTLIRTFTETLWTLMYREFRKRALTPAQPA